jgi:hypothetical protein
MPRRTKKVARFDHPLTASPVSFRDIKSHKPVGMDVIRLTDFEMKAGLTQIALDIFTVMTNAKHNFQDTLLAIYVSGLQHGTAISGGASHD